VEQNHVPLLRREREQRQARGRPQQRVSQRALARFAAGRLGRCGGAAAVQRFALEGFAARKRRHLQGR
jgi:hypothetical protein